MALPTAVRVNPGTTVNEKVPRAIIDPTEIAIWNLAPSAWWPSEAGMMEGVAAASVLPFKWKSNMDLQALAPAGAEAPIKARDTLIGADYLQFGYGGTLARRTLTLAHLRLVAAGSGYAVGDTITLANGVVVTVNAVTSGGVSSASDTITGMPTGFTITNYGAFSAAPSAVLAQTATSGSGSGATFMPSMKTQCGSLARGSDIRATAVIPANGIFSFFIVIRVPIPGGVAGADPGGFAFGAQVNQSEISDAASNNRWWGLQIPASGFPTLKLGGDATSIQESFSGRDGQWHVYLCTMNPTGVSAADSATLWRDGVQKATVSGYTAINALPSALNVRAGATGLPATGPTAGFAGDIAEIIMLPTNLKASANDAVRQAIGNYLLTKYRGSGTWA